MSSFRIEKLSSMASQYKVVWDLCCDHGLIGMRLLSKDRSVYFVDQVDKIMSDLEDKLKKSSEDFEYKCYLSDAKDIEIKNTDEEVCIIAGVGGYTCIKILESLLKRHGVLKSHFIISPQKNYFKVREFLSSHEFSVTSHEIINDREKYYDILKVRQEV